MGFFWKIGITVPNLDTVAMHLRRSGVSISQPRQFEDIGYMAHCMDPAGATVEVLQQGPKGSEPAIEAGHPVANGAILAHVTLRVRDPCKRPKFGGADQGMHLISVQPLDAYGFTLYFLRLYARESAGGVINCGCQSPVALAAP